MRTLDLNDPIGFPEIAYSDGAGNLDYGLYLAEGVSIDYEADANLSRLHYEQLTLMIYIQNSHLR